MPKTITVELPDAEQRKEMDDTLARYRTQIRETPALTSLLYDIDLLPEQIVLPVNVTRMAAVCVLFKELSPESIERLFST